MAQHKIDINKASKEEIRSVSGIGEQVAEEIVRYRQEHGSFKSVNELQNIAGIREKGFQQLENQFTTGKDERKSRDVGDTKSRSVR